MAALSAYRCNATIQAFAKRLKEVDQAFKVVIVACMRNLLTIMNAMSKNDSLWQHPIS
jgi:transposase